MLHNIWPNSWPIHTQLHSRDYIGIRYLLDSIEPHAATLCENPLFAELLEAPYLVKRRVLGIDAIGSRPSRLVKV